MNTKSLTLSLLLVISSSTLAQDRFITRSGNVKFFSSAPMEDIEAHTNKAASVLDIKKGEVAVDMLIKTFEFEKKLMQEHFNENYMESDKYPKATFKGGFTSNDQIQSMTAGTYEVTAKGELNVHGIKKQIEAPVTLIIASGNIEANLVFMVKVNDYGIKIPNVVVKNIAEEVEVTASFNYQPYKK